MAGISATAYRRFITPSYIPHVYPSHTPLTPLSHPSHTLLYYLLLAYSTTSHTLLYYLLLAYSTTSHTLLYYLLLAYSVEGLQCTNSVLTQY